MSNTFLDPVTGLATERFQLTGSNLPDGQTLWTPGMLYNETTSDKPRGNTQGILLATAARTATGNTTNQINYNARGVQVILYVSAAPVTPGTGGLFVHITGITSDGVVTYWLHATPAAVTTTGKYVYELYPLAGSAASGDVIQRTSGALPRTWMVSVVAGDAQSYTYSLQHALII